MFAADFGLKQGKIKNHFLKLSVYRFHRSSYCRAPTLQNTNLTAPTGSVSVGGLRKKPAKCCLALLMPKYG